jgi:hypothetical protein
MDEEFSHDRLAVFWMAADAAIGSNLGLIEAADLMMPNPFDDEKFECFCDIHHCQFEGWALYKQAALEQMGEVLQHIESSPPQSAPAKKGLFTRFFGRKD